MSSALVQEIRDREGWCEQQAELIAAIDLELINGDEFETDQHPGS